LTGLTIVSAGLTSQVEYFGALQITVEVTLAHDEELPHQKPVKSQLAAEYAGRLQMSYSSLMKDTRRK